MDDLLDYFGERVNGAEMDMVLFFYVVLFVCILFHRLKISQFDLLTTFPHQSPRLPSRNDKNIGIFLRRASLLALAGWLAPARLQAAKTAALTLFTTTVRVIHRVLRRATNCRTDTHPARAAGFADGDQAILFV